MGLPLIEMKKYAKTNTSIYYHVSGGIGNDNFYVEINRSKQNITFFIDKTLKNGKQINLSDPNIKQSFDIFDIDRRTVIQICGNIYKLIKQKETLPDHISFF